MLTLKSFLLEKETMANKAYKGLIHYDLTKKGGDRIDIFLQKIKDKDDFLTSKGLVKIALSEYDRLAAEMRRPGFSTTIRATIGGRQINVIYPKDFYKTPEFGGKGVGSGKAAEDHYLTMFRKELEKTMAANNSPDLTIKIGGRTVTCIGVRSTTQTGRYAPKSDFSLIDQFDKEIAWISHKAGRQAKDFQQYGGMTDEVFSENHEVQQFAEDVRKKYPNGMPPGATVYREVTDEKIIRLAVYGLRYGSSVRDNENIDEFHQGIMSLAKVPGGYTIKSAHKALNGEIPTGEYKACYVARYTSNVKYLGVLNGRLGIFPIGKIPTAIKI